MSYEIHVLDLGHVDLDMSVLVNRFEPGTTVTVPTYAHLIEGGEAPILVDTSFRDADLLNERGLPATRTEAQELEACLGRHGYDIEDIGYVLHTHLHIDHAGQDDRFPMDTPVVINRRELEWAVSGVMGLQYPPKDIKHIVDRLHTEGSLITLDLELVEEETILPGITCTRTGGHTEGSMNIHVETDDGTAVIISDIIYELTHQVIEPAASANSGRSAPKEPAPSGNHSGSLQQEKAAIKRALEAADFLVSMHDRPAKVNDKGEVVGRLFDTVPGSVYGVDEVDHPAFKFENTVE